MARQAFGVQTQIGLAFMSLGNFGFDELTFMAGATGNLCMFPLKFVSSQLVIKMDGVKPDYLEFQTMVIAMAGETFFTGNFC
jgi:hypothetical protein